MTAPKPKAAEKAILPGRRELLLKLARMEAFANSIVEQWQECATAPEHRPCTMNWITGENTDAMCPYCRALAALDAGEKKKK